MQSIIISYSLFLVIRDVAPIAVTFPPAAESELDFLLRTFRLILVGPPCSLALALVAGRLE